MTLNELIAELQRSQNDFGELDVTASFGGGEWNIVGAGWQAAGQNNLQDSALNELGERFTLELKDSFLPSNAEE